MATLFGMFPFLKTLFADGGHPTVQYEHTLVATKRGPVVVTMG